MPDPRSALVPAGGHGAAGLDAGPGRAVRGGEDAIGLGGVTLGTPEDGRGGVGDGACAGAGFDDGESGGVRARERKIELGAREVAREENTRRRVADKTEDGRWAAGTGGDGGHGDGRVAERDRFAGMERGDGDVAGEQEVSETRRGGLGVVEGLVHDRVAEDHAPDSQGLDEIGESAQVAEVGGREDDGVGGTGVDVVG